MRKLPVFILTAALASSSAFADDGAASIGAGGIILMKREPRIEMQKEVLTIGVREVRVDYEFRNDTDEDITTGVAFPVPGYKLDWDRYSIHLLGFDDFRLTVEGKPAHFDVEIRAKMGRQDVTDVLRKYGIDVKTFGHFDDDSHLARDLRKLSTAQRSSLAKAGLIEAETDQDEAKWTVEKKYFWSQTFPAHTTLHISHEYSPVVGFGMVPEASFRAAKQSASPAERRSIDADKDSLAEVKSVCPTDQLLSNLDRASGRSADGYGNLQYVDFILTTANTWKQPINDFTLFVERPVDKDGKYLVSFCWPSIVEQVGPNLFRAKAADLIPEHELRVGFFQVGK
jgi:hypothetical protein